MFKTYSIQDSFINTENKTSKQGAFLWESKHNLDASVELTLVIEKAEKINNKVVIKKETTVLTFQESQQERYMAWVKMLAINYDLIYQGRNIKVD